MARSSYIYVVLKHRNPGENIHGNPPVILCTVKYEMLNRVQQALDNGNLEVDKFDIVRYPDNGLFGNGTNITDQFVWNTLNCYN